MPPRPARGRRAARSRPGTRRPEPAYLEVVERRVFAAALDWPGWCRSGRDEAAALDALAAYGERFERVASRAGLVFGFEPEDGFDVVERLPGSATTRFGAPDAIRPADDEPIGIDEVTRTVALLHAAWGTLDDVVASSSAVLRKGPRGGGRDRDAIVEHVVSAEYAYAHKLGIPLRKVTAANRAAVESLRTAITRAVPDLAGGGRPGEKLWPARYAARRIAWHVLDHAWEIEDKQT